MHVIDSAASLQNLLRINLISYERLRMPVSPRDSRRVTFAHRLRRRIGLLIADEGERLAKPTSDQSRALWQLSARHRYVLTGSPIPSYPRDVFGLIAFTGGDGTAAQPYGYIAITGSPLMLEGSGARLDVAVSFRHFTRL